jgi:60 kDa SS-A/Ro ribonucleoprotein
MDVDESIPEPSESIPGLDESIPEPDESILDLPTSRSIPELDESIPEFLESTENDNRRPVDGMKRLHRFLILGSETPTYCIARSRLVREDARAILDLLQEGRGVDVVNEILRFSTQGRTVKQFPIMFALAICARNDDLPTKRRAYEVLPQVCRIPTHLFMFVSYCKEFCIKYQDQSTTGWGRAHRNAMKKWYISQASDPMKLAMDVTKYQKRKDWSHRDVARLTHLKPDAANVPDGLPTIMMYIARGWNEVNRYYFPENGIYPDRNEMTDEVLGFLKAVEDVKVLTGDDHQQQVANLILTHNLVREHIPAASLNSIEVGIYG